MTDTFTPSVRNITRLFRTATPEQIQSGADWYADAHRIAVGFSPLYSVTYEQAAGVIAATSPLQSWGANVNLAARILEANALGETLRSGYLSVGLDKAARILAGEDIETVLNGDKITNFYRGILTSGREGVCIDRHSWSLAVNHRYPEGTIPNLKGKRYALAVEAHVKAAKILSKEYNMEITPAQTQAVCWILWRRLWWSEGAFDGK